MKVLRIHEGDITGPARLICMREAAFLTAADRGSSDEDGTQAIGRVDKLLARLSPREPRNLSRLQLYILGPRTHSGCIVGE